MIIRNSKGENWKKDILIDNCYYLEMLSLSLSLSTIISLKDIFVI